MSDNMDPDDIYNPHNITPPAEASYPQTFSDLHGAKDTALDETPGIEASNRENEPKPPSSESPPEPLNVEDLPGATTAPEHPTSKDGGPGSIPSPGGPNDSARASDEPSDVNDEIEIDRALAAQPQGLVPQSGTPGLGELLQAFQALNSGTQPQTNGERGTTNIIILGLNVTQTTAPNQPAGDPPQTAANLPQPMADIPADEPTSSKASPTPTSSNEQETKPAVGSDKGEKIQFFIWGAMLPFRWMFRILLHKYVIIFIAILFAIFVLLPIVITLGAYVLSHAPSYVSNHILGKGYEYGNPFGVSYPTWMPWRGSSQNDTVPKMQAQDPSPLTFRRPIPQAETDILPNVILRYEECLADTNHKHNEELHAELAKSQKRAEHQKKFNRHFVDDMEAWSSLQYRHLQALVARVDLILKELSGEVARGRVAEGGDEWRWWESKTTARQKTLQRNLDWFNSIIDNINEGLSTGHKEIAGITELDGHVSGLKEQASGACRAREILRHSEDAESRDVVPGLEIICSSERRSGERWDQVREAIEKFKRFQEQVGQMFNELSKDSSALEDAYRDIKAFAMALMGALEEFSRLSEEEEG